MRCLVGMDREDVLTWVPESKRVTEASSHVSDVGNAPGGAPLRAQEASGGRDCARESGVPFRVLVEAGRNVQR